jgi:hypothetical protein
MTLHIGRRRIESETLHLPELRTMIGKDVDIFVVERESKAGSAPDLKSLDELAGRIDLDYQAIDDLRKTCIV